MAAEALAGFGIGKGSVRRWPDGVVPFVYAPELSARVRDLADQAMAGWNSRTGGTVRFVTRTSQADYLVLRPADDCLNRSPSIGRNGGAQDVFLGDAGCTLSLVLVQHELGHAMGLLHEHQRPDRDDVIVVHPENHMTVPGKEAQSAAQIAVIPEHSDPKHDPTMYGAYDLGASTQSIMHYGSQVQSNGQGPVMLRKNGGSIPNPTAISDGDVRTLQEIYSAQSSPVLGPDATLEERIAAIVAPSLSAQPMPRKAGALIVAVTVKGVRRYFTFGSIATGGRAPTSDDLWEIGSNTKVFTSLLLAALAENTAGTNAESVIQRKMTSVLPEVASDIRDEAGDARKTTITLEQLATHASGLPGEIDPTVMPRETSDYSLFFRQVAGVPLRFAPGDGHLYSNPGMSALGAALTAMGRRPFAELLDQYVIRPLALTSTGFAPNGTRVQGYTTKQLATPVNGQSFQRVPTTTQVGLVNQPTGGLLASGRDMMTFVEALMSPPANVAGNAIRRAKPIRQKYACLQDRTCGIGLGLEGMQETPTAWLRLKTGQTSAFSSVIAFREGEAGVFIAGNDRDLDVMPLAKRVLDAVRLDGIIEQKNALLRQKDALEARLNVLAGDLQNAKANAQAHANNAQINLQYMQAIKAQYDQQFSAFQYSLGQYQAHIDFLFWCVYYRDQNAYNAHVAAAMWWLALAQQIQRGALIPLRAQMEQREVWRNAEIAAVQGFQQWGAAIQDEAARIRGQLQAIADSLEKLKAAFVAGGQS